MKFKQDCEAGAEEQGALWYRECWAEMRQPLLLPSVITHTHTHTLGATFQILFWSCVVVQSLSCVWLFATPWTAAHQASLSFTISQSLLRCMSTELVMLSKHLTLCGHEQLFLRAQRSHSWVGLAPSPDTSAGEHETPSSQSQAWPLRIYRGHIPGRWPCWKQARCWNAGF